MIESEREWPKGLTESQPVGPAVPGPEIGLMTAGNHRGPHGDIEHIDVGQNLLEPTPAGGGSCRHEKPPTEAPAAVIGKDPDVRDGAGVFLVEG